MKRLVLIPLALGVVTAAGAGAAVLAASGNGSDSTTTRTTLTAVTAAQPAAATSSTETSKRCDLTAWADRVEGRPAGLDPHDKGGDYLWHDKDGFHLRATHRGDDKHVYSGSVTASTQIVDLKRIALEKQDKLWLSADHRTLHFQFSDHGFIDGADFRTACATTVTVANLRTGSSALPTDRVYLGHSKVHPAHIPFTVHREH